MDALERRYQIEMENTERVVDLTLKDIDHMLAKELTISMLRDMIDGLDWSVEKGERLEPVGQKAIFDAIRDRELDYRLNNDRYTEDEDPHNDY